jgi:hypothetical protein
MPTMTPQQLRDYEIRMHGINRQAAPRESQADTLAESDLQDRIVAYCRSKGWFVVFSGMHRRTSVPIGTPDFIIYADKGRVFTIETKSAAGKQTPEQLGVQLMLQKLGHEYHLVRSFEKFVEVIK